MVEVLVSVMSDTVNSALADQFLPSTKYVKSLPSQLGKTVNCTPHREVKHLLGLRNANSHS